MEALKINTAIQVNKSVYDVFEAIVDPSKMSNYFISSGSSRMEDGKTIKWKFPEFEETFEIVVLKVLADELVSFEWEGIAGRKTQVEIQLTQLMGDYTLINISEGTMKSDETGIRWFGQNTEGWANFLACLKAFLEHGINLRKGAFDFMKAAPKEN